MMFDELIDDVCDDENNPALEKVLDQADKKQSEKISRLAIEHNIKSDDPVWVLLQIVQSLEQISKSAEKHSNELEARKESIIAEMKLDAINDIAIIFDEKSDALVEIMRTETQKNKVAMASTYRKLRSALGNISKEQSKLFADSAIEFVQQTHQSEQSFFKLYAPILGVAIAASIIASIIASMIFLHC